MKRHRKEEINHGFKDQLLLPVMSICFELIRKGDMYLSIDTYPLFCVDIDQNNSLYHLVHSISYHCCSNGGWNQLINPFPGRNLK